MFTFQQLYEGESNPPCEGSLNDHVSTSEQPSVDQPSHDIPESSISSTHDALQHAPPSLSAFTPIVQIKENLVQQPVTTVNSAPVRLSPPPVITQDPPKAATEIIPNQPASLQTTSASVNDKAKQKTDNKSRSKEPPSYNQHIVGFKPSSSQPRSRDSDTESTSSSIRNSSVYGPTPYRRSVEAPIRRVSSVQRGEREKQKAPPHSQTLPYKPHSSGRAEPVVDREVASDTEAMPPPTSKPSTHGMRPVDTTPAPMLSGDLEIGTLEKALKTADDDPTPTSNTNGDIVKSTLKNVEVDESTGGGLLGMPGKIIIPERYNPAEDEDIEDKSKLSPEELAAREERAENIAKMLSEHSMQSWHPSEINSNWLKEEQADVDLHSKVEQEKIIRQETLAKARALAEEVKQHSLRRGRSLDSRHANSEFVEYSNQWSSEEER